MTSAVPGGQPRRSVVLPVHNEGELLDRTVRDLVLAMRKRGESFEVVIVENGSQDLSLQLAKQIAHDMAEVRVISLPHPDYGAAVAAGFAAARGDVVVNFDVDYIDFGFLESAVGIVDSGAAAIVLASKRAKGSSDGRPLLRRCLTAGFTFAMRLLLQVPVTDAHGMKVLDRAKCTTAARACHMTGALYDVELVLRASRSGLTVAELPAHVLEVRPPRTPLWHRSIESATGLLHLRALLWREALRRR